MAETIFYFISRNICGIYKVTNKTTNECYIGQAMDIRRRWAAHVSVAQRIKENRCIDKERQSPFDVSLSQHGWTAFTWEIIEVCSREKLDEREQYWIEYYDSYRHGYNATKGGQGFNKEKPDYVDTIKKLLKDTKLPLQEIADEVGVSYQIVSNINRGLHYVDSEYPTPIRPVCKGVIQYDLYSNEINHFDSVTEAAEYVNTNTGHISHGCQSNEVVKGFIWRYDTDPLKESIIFTKHHSKIVVQLDKDGNEVARYNCLQDAATAMGCSTKDHIGRVCRGERSTYKGYVWKYLD